MNVGLLMVAITALALGYAAVFAASALAVPVGGADGDTEPRRSRPGRLAAKSRLGLATAALDVVAVLVLARQVAPWTTSPPALWLSVTWMVPVALLAVGVGAAVLYWHRLPAVRPGRSPRGAWIGAAVHVGILLGIVAAVLWPR